MFKKYRQRRRIVESLESRQLLTACNIPFEELLPGDANMDCYYDEADILQMFKAGKLDTGEAAVWEEGDFDGNGVFDGTDFELAAQNGNLVRYRFTRVPYDERATEPTNTLQPISTDGSADTTLYYFSETGQLYVVAESGLIYMLHLHSQSGSVTDGEYGGYSWTSEYDQVSVFSSIDRVGVEIALFTSVLPAGWTDQQVMEDLLVDGAMLGGGDLGNVRLGSVDEFPGVTTLAFDVVPEPPPQFVPLDEANAVVTYDPDTGDMLIEALDYPIYQVEFKSNDGLFVGAEIYGDKRYEVETTADVHARRYSRIALSGDIEIVDGEPVVTTTEIDPFWVMNAPELVLQDLTADEFLEDVEPTGYITTDAGLERIQFAFQIGKVFGACREHIDNGEVPGDADLNGVFNSSDLVQVFQASEYRDATEDNSVWEEGDWTCDGDFDTDDLVAAFQTGKYEAAASLALKVDESIRLDGMNVDANSDDLAIRDAALLEAADRDRQDQQAIRILAAAVADDFVVALNDDDGRQMQERPVNDRFDSNSQEFGKTWQGANGRDHRLDW